MLWLAEGLERLATVHIQGKCGFRKFPGTSLILLSRRWLGSRDNTNTTVSTQSSPTSTTEGDGISSTLRRAPPHALANDSVKMHTVRQAATPLQWAPVPSLLPEFLGGAVFRTPSRLPAFRGLPAHGPSSARACPLVLG